jgi:hypothetical protein
MIRRFWRGYGELLRHGLGLWRAAPLIPLIAIVTEFVQHIVEVRLGMFASKAAFHALAFDPLRWQAGYIKIAGFWIAIFAAMIATGGLPLGSVLRAVPWRRALFALALNAVVVALSLAISERAPSLGGTVLNAILSIVTLPLLTYLIGALLNDPAMDLRAAYTRGWWRLLRMALLVVPVFAMGQLVHMLDHTLAIGRPPMVVWALMSWDALWIGVMACCTGAALAVGYRLAEARGP